VLLLPNIPDADGGAAAPVKELPKMLPVDDNVGAPPKPNNPDGFPVDNGWPNIFVDDGKVVKDGAVDVAACAGATGSVSAEAPILFASSPTQWNLLG
jgi:hypothetical protein